MSTLNLGILAHVDAGKTSLTERLLYAAGFIDAVGRVDDGSTQTDTLALERQRGITIKSAVVSFDLADLTVNLIDTPGHPDFIAEVERVLGLLDGAVLVISAVEGVQAQTRLLMRALRRLRIPTLLFVNKIDRRGARSTALVPGIAEKLTPAVVALGTVEALGTRAADYRPFGSDADPGPLIEVLADIDDGFLANYVARATPVAYAELRPRLAAQTRAARAHPVIFGSALTGAGVDALLAALPELLPRTEGDATAPVSGTVFKVDRGPAGERVAYVRLFSGTIRPRDWVRLPGGRQAKVTAVRAFARGTVAPETALSAGRIGQLWGLGEVRIGDSVGLARNRRDHHFAPPTLETVVAPRRRADRRALQAALTQLAEQDPLINLRQDDVRSELSVSLYGEVQKEVIAATLATDFGVEATFRETTTLCVERPVGTGAAVELIGAEENPILATVGLRVDPAPPGAGVTYAVEVELGSMPPAFFTAVAETVREALGQGLYGWPVIDCTVTMTHSGYWARQSHAHATFDKSMSSTARDFRQLTPLVLMAALRAAGTQVCEPVHRFALEFPADVLGSLLAVLARLGGTPETPQRRGATGVLAGEIPAAQVHALTVLLPGLTSGEGVLESAFARYAPVRGTPPERPPTDLDPRHREEYLRRVLRRTAGPLS